MVSIYETDEDGLIICPCCGKHYKPDLEPRKAGDRRCIQEIYPKATVSQREQLLTGMCSDECWSKYLGG